MPKSFFQKKYTTRKINPCSKQVYEIDQFLMKRGDLKGGGLWHIIFKQFVFGPHAIFIKIRLAKGLQVHKKPKVKDFQKTA